MQLLALPETERISIHAPRAGGDFRPPPAKGETKISIHAPRAGGDRRA